jgi:hypothetical protein
VLETPEALMSQITKTPLPPAADSLLSDDDIALLCDIGDSFPAKLGAGKMRRLERLIAEGFVEPASAAKAPAKYQLTAEAQKFLGERGVGLNEA